MSFPCQRCTSESTQVKDSRPFEGGIRRRRVCPICDHRFTTKEFPVDEQTQILDLSGIDPTPRRAIRTLIRALAGGHVEDQSSEDGPEPVQTTDPYRTLCD